MAMKMNIIIKTLLQKFLLYNLNVKILLMTLTITKKINTNLDNLQLELRSFVN